MPIKIVSFIIPSYNSVQTVKRCLDSIYALSLKPDEFEVIFVDDCSTDNTVEIVEAYSQLLTEGEGVNNLTLLKQHKNNRQGAARNRGVNVANGEYICFVDSDDAVTEGIVDAIRLAKEKQTDMVPYHHAFVNEAGMIIQESDKLSFAKGQVFSGVEMQNAHPYWCSGPVAYIYNRAFLERVNYPFMEGVLFEDSDFVVVHMYYAKRMTYSPVLGYLVYYREGSTTHSSSYRNVADYLLLGTRMLVLYENVMGDVSCKTYDVSETEIKKFAEGILEGACWNVEKSCKRLIKLANVKEVCAYYERLDAYINRKAISNDVRLRKYYWNGWTTLCLKHKYIAIVLLAVLIPMYKLVKRIRK